MNLHEIALTQGVKRTDTSKLFWGEYAYSLKTAIPENFLEDRREAMHQFWIKAKDKRWADVQPNLGAIHSAYRSRLQEHIDGIIDRSREALCSTTFYYLSGDKNTTFYVKNEEVAASLIRDNPGMFFAYSAPRSEQVAVHLKEVAGKKIEVRERGWYGEFDHKITFKWKQNFDELDERVERLCLENSIYSYGNTRILYLSGDDDFFLAKLALSEHIESVTRCVTTAEVEAGTVEK